MTMSSRAVKRRMGEGEDAFGLRLAKDTVQPRSLFAEPFIAVQCNEQPRSITAHSCRKGESICCQLFVCLQRIERRFELLDVEFAAICFEVMVARGGQNSVVQSAPGFLEALEALVFAARISKVA